MGQLLGNPTMVDALLSRVRHYCHTIQIDDHRCAIRKAEERPWINNHRPRRLRAQGLEAYRNTPGTSGNLRRPDRMLAVSSINAAFPCPSSRTHSCWPRFAA